MMSYAPSLRDKAAATLELRRRRQQRLAALRGLSAAAFIGRTKIEVPVGEVDSALVPFELWPAQHQALGQMQRERLIVFLKARQLGISWLVCGFVLEECTLTAGQTWLLFSQGQLEANELTRRISLMHHAHEDRAALPSLVKDNTGELAWSNGSRVVSLSATKKAGRSFTASGVVLDEWAFMTWGREVLAAVKPTIDAGGKLFIISSADGNGTPYHQFWNAAAGGASGYRPIFLPWDARPDRGPDWRDQKLAEANGDTASVLREYPANDIEAFTHAVGLVYGDQWSDGPADGNVTEDADYVPGVGDLLWGLDDGYAGALDAATQQYTAESHPRVVLLAQHKPDGHLDIVAESYAVRTLPEAHIADVLALPYPEPDWAVCDSSAAELRRRLVDAGIPARRGTHPVEQGVTLVRAWLAPDANGWRRIRVHPRCRHLRAELASYRVGPDGKPIKQFDHGPDVLRYLSWALRYQE